MRSFCKSMQTIYCHNLSTKKPPQGDVRGSTSDSIRTTLIGGKIPLGLRFETPVQECLITYFTLITICIILLCIYSFYKIILSYIPVLIFYCPVYNYACSPFAPPTILFQSPSWSLIPFYFPISNIALNLVLKLLSLVPVLLIY